MTTEMKSSGIRWIGNIPTNWDVNKIKYLATLKGRIGWQGLTSDEYTDEGAFLITGTDFDNGRINWDTCVHVPIKRWEEARDIQIENGDLLITKDGTVGKVAIVTEMHSKVSLNSGVLRIVTWNGYDRNFLYWVLQSEVFWTWFNYKNAGNSTIIHLYQGDFAGFVYPIPPVGEQQLIATHLNEQCGKIDNIIAGMEQQVETLRKYRKSLITETVTKGLDNTVAMKNSGIDWIGMVPTDWSYKRLKYVCDQIGDIDHRMPDSVDEGIPYVMTGDFINENDIDFINAKKISRTDFNELSKKIRPHRNDILFARYATIGAVRIVDVDFDFLVSYSCVIIKTNSNIVCSRFLFYYFKSYVFDEEVKKYINTNTQSNVGMDSLNNISVVMPPIDVQNTIVEYLDVMCKKIDAIIMEKQQAVDTMQQHKKSLIYEYVTGKKRVKEVTSCQ